MRGGIGLRPLTILLVAALLLTPLILAAHPSRGDQIIDYPVVSEFIVEGASDGFQNEASGDSVYNLKTEHNNGTATALMLPNGDVSVDWDYVGPTSYECTPETHFCRLVDALEPDGNTSYITSLTDDADPSDVDTFHITDPALPATAVISLVTAFVWARQNTTGNDGPSLQVDVDDPAVGNCISTIWREGTGLTQAFKNFSVSWANSCDGTPWTAADLADLDMDIIGFETTAQGVDLLTVTYAGVIVTYQTPYWLDISEVINVPTEQVSQVEIFLSCSLAGDTEGFTMQINGITAATDLCIAPNIDTRYVTDARGDVVIRTYSNPDPTQTTYSIDLLVARVTIIEGGGTFLKPPDPDCYYNPLFQTLDCVDVQSYYDLNVQWVRWQLDDGQSISSVPNGRVSLPSNDGPLEIGSRPHVLKATAVYLTGAEKSVEQTIHTDNGIRLIIFIGVGGIVFIFLVVVYEKRQKRRYS